MHPALITQPSNAERHQPGATDPPRPACAPGVPTSQAFTRFGLFEAPEHRDASVRSVSSIPLVTNLPQVQRGHLTLSSPSTISTASPPRAPWLRQLWTRTRRSETAARISPNAAIKAGQKISHAHRGSKVARNTHATHRHGEPQRTNSSIEAGTIHAVRRIKAANLRSDHALPKLRPRQALSAHRPSRRTLRQQRPLLDIRPLPLLQLMPLR